MSLFVSKEKLIDNLNLRLSGAIDLESTMSLPGTCIVKPGDLLFFVTHYPERTCEYIDDRMKWKWKILIALKPWWKQWLSLDKRDFDDWHTGIYFMARKRKHHKRINLWIIHSISKRGVHIAQFYAHYTNRDPEAKKRIEILSYEGISDWQRKCIAEYAYSKVGSEFDRSPWRYTLLTYVLGLPVYRYSQSQFSCQQLALAAYAAAGIYFSHPYRSFPIFNMGRFLGHPLGHPKEGVNPRYPYLLDHHLYRNPRLILKAIVQEDPETHQIKLETKNLKKYSWDEKLRERYLAKGYIAC